MKQIGNYTVEDIPIGSGGMGQVYRGVSNLNNRQVAVKEILPQFTSNPEYRSRILREISFLSRLDNDSVVKVFDSFELGDKLYIVLEYVDGLNIEQYVEQNGAIPWTEAVTYMIKILRTLQDVHEHSIVHRDIKPSNIMIREDNSICLLDFGIAKDVSATARDTNPGTMFGTIIGTDGYMSPEQAMGLSIDHRTDVYALGCVLYYMLTGSHAFQATSEFQMAQDIINKPFPRLSERIKGIPGAVQDVLDNAVDKNMMRRYQSCREFADSLMRVLPGGTQINTLADNDMLVVTVGRENCDICIGQENFKVSRHHGDIKLKIFTGGEYYVYTDCSSNGTMINGQMLRRGMTYNIPRGEEPEIYLAGDPTCRLAMSQVEDAFRSRIQLLQQSSGGKIKAPKPGKKENTPNNRPAVNNRDDYAQPEYGENREVPMMTFGDAIKSCFSKYATFNGRASRAEYWWWVLFNVLVSIGIYILIGISAANYSYSMISTLTTLSYIWSLGTLLPSLAVCVRRLHDVGKSGWYYFIGLIPLVGAIILIVEFCKAGNPEPNKYGYPYGTQF